MKKYLPAFFALVFISNLAWADELTDSMEAALAQHSESSVTQLDVSVPASTAPEPVSMPEASSAPAMTSQTPAAPIVEATVSEPVKARDVLPKEAQPEESQDVAVDEEGEIVLDEEGNAVSAKSLLLDDAAKAGMLMLADFDAGDKPNNLGGDFGGWDKDPSDDTQGCRATFASDDSTGNIEGFALRLDYDVDSPSPAYNGFWMKLENANALPYDTLSFDVRGASHKFTKRLKVELKTPDSRSSSFFISGITDQWQTIQIPLKRFKGIKDWSVLSEMILVFDDVNTAPKKGTLLVDQIRFERLENGMPQKDKAEDATGYYLSDDKGPEELINRPS